MGAAAAAPDHGELIPWRFVIIPDDARSSLADAFAASLRERDAQATEEQLTQARDKAFRSPLLLLAVATMGEPAGDIPPPSGCCRPAARSRTSC
ncbi:nitroreductase family protein [Ramlibacter montanisoli]|uniref:nitroreductase family protein n=1 Tax=Ramlibacter montanisoli TaxID=2732512 RepID=UPI0028168E04|nr:nitroreductase family protein [Ramlibacter montanisoli]